MVDLMYGRLILIVHCNVL